MEPSHLILSNTQDDMAPSSGALVVPTDTISTTIVYNLIAIAIVFIIWVVKSDKRGGHFNVSIKLTRDIGVNTCDVDHATGFAEEATAEEDALVQEIINDLYNLSLKLDEGALEIDGELTRKFLEEKDSKVTVSSKQEVPLLNEKETSALTCSGDIKAELYSPAAPIACPAAPIACSATPIACPAIPIACPAAPIDCPATQIACPAAPIACPAAPIAPPVEVTIPLTDPVKKRRSRLPVRRKTIGVVKSTDIFDTSNKDREIQTPESGKHATLSRQQTGSQPKRERFFSERDMYCQACLHNDVILRSPLQDNKRRIRRTSAVMKPIRTTTKTKLRQTPGTFKNKKLNGDTSGNFVSNPRGYYPATNRKLVKIDYNKTKGKL